MRHEPDRSSSSTATPSPGQPDSAPLLSLCGPSLRRTPFRNLSDEVADRLQLNERRGLSQDYAGVFATLIVLASPDNAPELKPYLLTRLAERIAELPSYPCHVARRLRELQIDVPLSSVLQEATDRRVDLTIFERIIKGIQAINLRPESNNPDQDLDQKLFELRLWCALAIEAVDSDTMTERYLGVERCDLERFRAEHPELRRRAA